MLLIQHRVNTREDLKRVPPERGVEVDVRYKGTSLILQHDPYADGEPFEDWLAGYRHAFLIVNVKSEGVEDKALELLKKHGVRAYFFLDLSFPALVKLARQGEKNIAVRFSEHEPLEACLAAKDLARWVWVDCFTRLPLDARSHAALSKQFKLCVVSPELERHDPARIDEFKKLLVACPADAVCTKFPDRWLR